MPKERPVAWGLLFGTMTGLVWLLATTVDRIHGERESVVLFGAVLYGISGGLVAGIISYFRRRYNDESPRKHRGGRGHEGATGNVTPFKS
jgi:hypothetical protein